MKKRIKASSNAPFQSRSCVEGFLRLRKLLILLALSGGIRTRRVGPATDRKKGRGVYCSGLGGVSGCGLSQL